MAINTLYDYFKSTGKAMPTIAGRTSDAKNAGISNYTGTADQNNQLLSYYLSTNKSTTPSTTPTPTTVATANTPKTTNVATTPAPTLVNTTVKTTTPTTAITTPTTSTTAKTGTGVIKTETLNPNQTTTADQKTVADTYKQLNIADLTAGIDNRANSLADKQYNDYISQGNEVVDEQAIRKSFRDRVQAQIDGINNAYSTMLANSKVKTNADQGVARAINARSGLLGSDFSTADEMNISKAGTEMQNSLESERQAKINALLNEADDSATSYLTTKRQQVQSANDNAMKLLLTRETSKAGTASKIAQYLLAKGVKSLDEISHDDMSQIQSNYGLSLADISSAFNTVNSAKIKADQETALANAKLQNEINSGRFKSVSDGAYLYDTTTGQYVENPKNFAPKTGSGLNTILGGSGTGSITSVEDAMQRIANIESRGSKDRFGGTNPYQVVSVPSANGDKAYGKYQVMGANIPNWTREVLGKSLSIEQFLNSPEAQDAVAKQKLQDAYDKHGSWADSASVWFSGRPLAGNTSKDILGTSTPMYVNKFLNQGGDTTISPEAQYYVNAIKRGDMDVPTVLSKLGSSKDVIPLKNEIMKGIDVNTADGNRMVTKADYDSLLNTLDNLNKIDTSAYGGLDTKGGFFSSMWDPDSNASIDQVIANLSLDARSKLKGSGAISDFEAKTLGDSVTTLGNRRISEAKAKEEIQKIRNILQEKISSYKTNGQVSTEAPADTSGQSMFLNGVEYRVGADGQYYPVN